MPVIEYFGKTPTKKKETLGHITAKTAKQLVITLSCLIVTLSSVLLIINSKTQENGYDFEQKQLEQDHLISVNESITNKITRITAISTVLQQAKIKNMEKPQETLFISEEDNKI